MNRRPSTPLHLVRQALAAAALAGLGAAAAAQSLQDVYEAARAYDAAYLAARAKFDATRYAIEQSYALRRPGVSLSGSAARSEIDLPGAAPKLDARTDQLTLSAKQPLYNRANGLSIEQSERQAVLAQADLDTAEQDLIVRVGQAYFDVLTAQSTQATAQAALKAYGEQLASAKRNFEVGTATITDTREAQARYDLGAATLIRADNDLRTKRIALDQLVGRQGIEPKALALPITLPDLLPADPEAWVASADTRNPSVRRARTALEIAELETGKARAGHLPTVDLVGSYVSSHAGGSSATRSGTAGTTGTGTVALQLNLPLFAGFAVQNRVRETLSLEDKARHDLEAARRGVALGTRQAHVEVVSGMAQVKALEAAEASSKLALEATQLGYKVGVRVNLDVLNAQSQLYQTQRDLAAARHGVLVGSLRLKQTTGQLGADDIAAMQRLIAR